jgi:hypothetical protein
LLTHYFFLCVAAVNQALSTLESCIVDQDGLVEDDGGEEPLSDDDFQFIKPEAGEEAVVPVAAAAGPCSDAGTKSDGHGSLDEHVDETRFPVQQVSNSRCFVLPSQPRQFGTIDY